MSLEIIYSSTDIFLLVFCLTPIFTFIVILILNVLLKEKKYRAAVLSVQLLVFTLATIHQVPLALCLAFN